MTTPSDAGSGKTGGLLARLRGMMQALTASEARPSKEIVPTWDKTEPFPIAMASEVDAHPPVATPDKGLEQNPPRALPVPVADSPSGVQGDSAVGVASLEFDASFPLSVASGLKGGGEGDKVPADTVPLTPALSPEYGGDGVHQEPTKSGEAFGAKPAALQENAGGPAIPTERPTPPTASDAPVVEQEPVPVRYCPACQAVRGKDSYCDNCGYLFPPEDNPRPEGAVLAPQNLGSRLRERYELTVKLSERCGVERFRGLDHNAASERPSPVVIVRMAAPPLVERPAEYPRESDKPFLAEKVVDSLSESVPLAEQATHSPKEAALEDEVLPGLDTPPSGTAITQSIAPAPGWPSVGWERNLLEIISHSAFPKIIDSFNEGGFEYLVEEMPVGRSLWDAWDDPEATAEQRFGWLKQIAEALNALHLGRAILEALRPDIVIVNEAGQARFTDLSDLLPVPLPPDVPLRATFYTAPELIHAGNEVDARADLYSFGAMLYALHVGRELGDMDFERPGLPKPFIPRFPDIHPLFGRLVSKTFRREVRSRFPTEEAAKDDPTGFTELIMALEVAQQTFDNVRLEIAAWTTTGMVRSGNEDAFALMHAAESRQNTLQESALVLLADGMGGYEAGEVAAALAIHSLRQHLLEQPPFNRLAGNDPNPSESLQQVDRPVAEFDIESCKRSILAALKNANKEVYNASRNGVGKRGMGCTAEAVYVTGRHVIVGHVGDSRTYHLHEGRLIQLTRDHTLVGRLVELGTLTPEEAENHPRKNELQQAIGGRSDIEPGIYHGRMKPGDWVVVCSDGVTNHVNNRMLKEMLQSEATSAEMAARRLVNLVNVEGATDNATVVVVRAT